MGIIYGAKASFFSQISTRLLTVLITGVIFVIEQENNEEDRGNVPFCLGKENNYEYFKIYTEIHSSSGAM